MLGNKCYKKRHKLFSPIHLFIECCNVSISSSGIDFSVLSIWVKYLQHLSMYCKCFMMTFTMNFNELLLRMNHFPQHMHILGAQCVLLSALLSVVIDVFVVHREVLSIPFLFLSVCFLKKYHLIFWQFFYIEIKIFRNLFSTKRLMICVANALFPFCYEMNLGMDRRSFVEE